MTDDPDTTVERATEDLALDGIKIHLPQGINANDYREDPDTRGLAGLRVLYERCEQAGIPIMIHTGTSIIPDARSRCADPMPIDDIAVDFPNLPIVMAHGGRPMYTDEAWFLLYRHENVFLDISSFPPQNLFEYFPEINRVADRVLFGSDWLGQMVPDIGTNIEAIQNLELPQHTIDAILRGNADRLYDL
ncbi:amidohydrolase family protein [Haladaptatus pallidirubidus]|uniref:Amidohydrolase-related domain-containing protein n=1 Tax=Haladaptatus pallidirubidus TaxID=1008152 RepID=A0AAV3UIG5_9EURY|nr:amidohydrolase family protein [Haladaptatus pallidirubidus]